MQCSDHFSLLNVCLLFFQDWVRVPVLAVLPGLGVCASPGCSSRTGCVCQSWRLSFLFKVLLHVCFWSLCFWMFHSPSSDSHELFSFLSNDLCASQVLMHLLVCLLWCPGSHLGSISIAYGECGENVAGSTENGIPKSTVSTTERTLVRSKRCFACLGLGSWVLGSGCPL